VRSDAPEDEADDQVDDGRGEEQPRQHGDDEEDQAIAQAPQGSDQAIGRIADRLGRPPVVPDGLADQPTVPEVPAGLQSERGCARPS
jgi:hypothetical protein